MGQSLPALAPRKGLLQAAAASGVVVIAPDLATSVFGAAAFTARSAGVALSLDPTSDLMALTERLAARPRLTIIRTGDGASDTLLGRARDVASALGETSPTLTSSVSLGTTSVLAVGDHHVATSLDPVIGLPLLVTGLAQRVPGVRPSARHQVAEPLAASEPALA